MSAAARPARRRASVLDGIARALQLDEAERAHLFDLARGPAGGTAAPRAARRAGQPQIRPSVRRILDSITAPAYIRNYRLDILAANRLGEVLFAPVLNSPARPANNARFLFLDPAAPAFYPGWERQAQDVVAMLRTETGRNPNDKALSNLVGELSTRLRLRPTDLRVLGRARQPFRRRAQAPRHPGRHPRAGRLRLGCAAGARSGCGENSRCRLCR